MEEEATNPVAELRVFHQYEGDYTSRIIHLSLDGRRFASLKSGQACVVRLKPGRHTLQADNTFMKKKESFDVRPGEEVRYMTRNRYGFGSGLIGIFGAGPLYLILKREAEAARLG